MRGENYNKIIKGRAVSEIWVDFDGRNGRISFGQKLTPKEVGLALEDLGKFIQNIPEDSKYADYDEGDMCCG